MLQKIIENQEVIIKNNLDLDLVDLTIFALIKKTITYSNMGILGQRYGGYTWISHSYIMDKLPLIKIKTNRGLQNRINKLINANLIKRDSGAENMSLYKADKNFNLLDF